MSIRLLVTRIIHQLRCWWSIALSLLGIVRVRHLPTFVSIEPANYCQLRCPECPVGQGHAKRPAQRMSWEIYVRILEEIQVSAHTIQFYFQGEPLLHPLLPKMIARAREQHLFTIVSTNAQALTQDMAQALVQSGLNRIIVSIDGFSQSSYEAYRVGGHLDKALAGLQYLSQARKANHSNICIELQVLRLKTNENEWQWIQKHYRSLGATRLVFKTAQLYDYTNGHPLMPSNAKYARYRQASDGHYYLHRSFLRRHWFNTPCARLWSGCVITTTGDVLPCCYDKAGDHSFGSITTTPLATLWHSTQANSFRHKVLHLSQHIPICKECNH